MDTILAFDFGLKRIGVAVGNTGLKQAQPLAVISEVELELDSGEKRTLRQSDTCVQRGTNHLWRNNTDQWTRIAFILLSSKQIVIDGKQLSDHGFPGQE